MRLKSLYTRATNQRIKRTCVANIFMLCLLSLEVCSNANIKHQRLVRQLNAKRAANYDEDFEMTNSYHQPHFIGNRSVVVQLFEWKFVDIAAECRDFLGPQGYAGVQLSPVLEHTVFKTADLNHPWWERYEVVSYRLASRSGDESEFWSMSRICNEHGVRIYADVVLNHMAAPLNFVDATTTTTDNEDFIVNTLLETNVNISQQHYSNVPYTQLDFHQPSCMIWDNVQDAHEIRNCQLNGHPDLDHSRGHVQKQIVKMLNKFIDMGVAGFRIDTAKYIWPIDMKNMLKQVKNLSKEFNFKENSRPFVCHDVFDLGLDTVSKTEYSTYGVVSEYLYPAELSTILRGKVALSSLINWGPALGFLPHEDSLVFIDSHDIQRGLPANLGNNQMLSYKQRIKYLMANVFMLVHPYGAIKRIMSSYYFPDTDINQGPPWEEANEEEISSPKFNKQKQCTKESGWVCEHRWPELVSMLKVANYFRGPGNKEESIIFFQTNGANQVTFCRGYKAFVAINNDPVMDFVKEVYACLEPGLYCDMVTGGKKEGKEECHGKILEINEQGYMKLALSAADDSQVTDEAEMELEAEEEEEEEESGKITSYGIVVIYVESKIKPANKNNGEAESNEENQSLANEDNGDIETKKSKASDENIEVDGNQLKENAKEGNNEDKEIDDDQKDIENEDQTETEIEPPAENDNEPEEADGDGGEEKSASSESDVKENESKENSVVDNKEAKAEEDGLREEVPASDESPPEDTKDDENQSKENAEEDNKSKNEVEQPHESDNEADLGEGKAAEENLNDEVNKEDKKLEENVNEEVPSEQENPAEDEAKEKVSNEDQEVEQNIENEVPEGEENANQNEEENAEEQNNKGEEENSNSEENNVDVEENSKAGEEKATPHDLPKEEEGKTEQEDPKEESDTGNNQSRNLDGRSTEAEAQIEKPSAEVVDNIDDSPDAVTAKIKDIQTAGFVGNPNGNNNNG